GRLAAKRRLGSVPSIEANPQPRPTSRKAPNLRSPKKLSRFFASRIFLSASERRRSLEIHVQLLPGNDYDNVKRPQRLRLASFAVGSRCGWLGLPAGCAGLLRGTVLISL